MNILWKYTLRALRLNRRRTVVTIIGVVLSCALLCGTAILGTSFRNMGTRTEIASNGNWHVSFTDLSNSKTTYLLDNAHTKTGMRYRLLGYAAVPKLVDGYTPYIHVVAYDHAMLQNQPLKLVSGRMPRQTGEIVLSNTLRTSGAASYKSGDTIRLNIGQRMKDGRQVQGSDGSDEANYEQGETLQNTKQQTFTVVGFIEQPSYILSDSAGYFAVTYLDAAALLPTDKVDVKLLLKQPYNTYKIAPRMAQSVGLTLHANGKNADGMTYNYGLLPWLGARSGEKTDSSAMSFVQVLLAILGVIVAIILFGSIIVIRNAFALSVDERKRQFGMFSSVGATPRQLRRTVGLEALFIGVIGIPIGLLVGLGAIAGLIAAASAVLKTLIDHLQPINMVVPPYVLAIVTAVAALTVWLSAALPARRAAKVTPIEAIRQAGDFTVSRRRLRVGRLWRRLLGFEGELALKNLKRSRRKYRTTVISLCASIVMFLSFSSFMQYVSHGMNSAQDQISGYDITLSLYSNSQSYEAAQMQFAQKAVALPQVKKSEIDRSLSGFYKTDLNGLDAGFRRNKAAMKGLFSDSGSQMNDQTHVNLSVEITSVGRKVFDDMLQTQKLNPAEYMDTAHPKGILSNRIDYVALEGNNKFTSIKGNFLSVQAGNALSVYETSEMDTSKSSSSPLELGIGAVLTNPTASETVYGDYVQLYVSDAVFDSLAPHFTQQDNPVFVRLKTRNSKANTDLMASLKQLYAQAHPNTTLPYTNTLEEQRQSELMIWLVRLFCYSFIAVITLVGVTNIINTISTNMRLRRREFAVLESVGMTPRGFRRALSMESLLYGLKALLYALPISLGINALFYKLFAQSSLSSSSGTMPFMIPWEALLAMIAAVFVLVFCTTLYSAAKAKGESLIETIREENI